jgi:hypothetical protein
LTGRLLIGIPAAGKESILSRPIAIAWKPNGTGAIAKGWKVGPIHFFHNITTAHDDVHVGNVQAMNSRKSESRKNEKRLLGKEHHVVVVVVVVI